MRTPLAYWVYPSVCSCFEETPLTYNELYDSNYVTAMATDEEINGRTTGRTDGDYNLGR